MCIRDRGGPNGATTLISMLIYNNAFLRHKMGMASAQAWILFLICLLYTSKGVQHRYAAQGEV